MAEIINIEKVPSDSRDLVEKGLSVALKKKKLGKADINFIQIEKFLSGGKTGAVVFVARYGISESSPKSSKAKKKPVKKTTKKSAKMGEEQQEPTFTFVRVLKIAPRTICLSENEGYVKTRETLLDIFSQVEYFPEDEFIHEDKSYDKPKKFGILLYQDVGAISAATDLSGIATFFTNKINKLSTKKDDVKKFSLELSLLMQKEIFLGLKKGLYGNLQRKNVFFKNYYGKKISKSVEKGIEELKEIDSSLPDISFFREAFAFHGIYHQVAYIHGDLNPENVLVWENERRILICKLIDFGEVIPKKKENFTPLFWDFSRLLGEMILNFVEETTLSKNENNQLDSIEKFKEDFWDIIESFFQNNTTKLEKADLGLGFIARIYLSNLFDFINEAKSGIKDLRRMEVIQDYFYCQSLFFIFYSKFQKENPYKRLFGLKLAIKFLEYASSRANSITSIIESLEKFYFQFSRGYLPKQKKHKGPDVGARSPFKGLAYFEEKDQDLFFGREKVTEDLINAIEAKSIVALAGTSGSGKSSVVHAGVIPGLRKKGYIIFKFRPGSNPIQSAIQGLNRRTDKKNKNGDLKKEDDRRERESDLRTILRSILEDNKDKKVFLLGDQLEELFTLFNDEMEKKELGNSILDIANEFKDRFRFLITIRADFWGKLLEDPSFGSVVGDSGDKKDMGVRFFLSPMNTDELRSAIEEPLKKFNLQIQEELTDLMISSLSGQSGGLPLLQFCLEELWKRQEDYTLTYEAYKEIGEVKGALATYAEQIYKSLKKVEKDALKKIMVQLIQPGHGTEDTRRIALVSEVVSQNLIEIENEKSKKKKNKTEIDEEKENFNIKEFIEKLTNLRLITIGTNNDGEETIEVVHETLIREWDKLREWINNDREFRVWQEKVRLLMKEWVEHNENNAYLLFGTSLITAKDWYKNKKNELGQGEKDYIKKSITKDWKRKLFILSGGLLVASLIVGFGAFGWIQNGKVQFERIRAERAKEEALKAKAEAEEAVKKAELAKKEAEDAVKKAEAAKKDAEKANLSAKEFEEKAKLEREKAEQKEKDIKAAEKKLKGALKIDLDKMEKASLPENWGDYIGKYNYWDAMRKCKAKGMRIPELGEWHIGYSHKIFKKWNPKGLYWISGFKRGQKSSAFNIDISSVDQVDAKKKMNLRCIK